MPAKQGKSRHVNLTEAFVSRLKPAKAAEPFDYYSATIPNFALRLRPPSLAYRSGLLSWRYASRFAGSQFVLTWHYPAVSAKEAHSLALQAWSLIERGQDPRPVLCPRRAPAAAVAAAPIDSVKAMWGRYQPELDQKSQRHRLAVTSYFNRFVLPVWAERDVHVITKREIVDLLKGVEAKSGPISANRCGTAISAWFSYLVKQGVLISSVATALPRTQEAPRARSLSVAELCLVWRAADRIGGPAGRGVQLLIATATRRDEAYRLPRTEIDTGTREWLLPAARNKSKRDFLIPLTPLAMSVLSACPNAGDFYFSSSGKRPIGGYDHIKRRLDAAIAELQEPGQASLSAWTFHDIRRGVRSALPALGVGRDIAEKIFNHVPSKLEQTYDRYEYATEKRAALGLWSDHFTAALAASTTEARQAAD